MILSYTELNNFSIHLDWPENWGINEIEWIIEFLCLEWTNRSKFEI